MKETQDILDADFVIDTSENSDSNDTDSSEDKQGELKILKICNIVLKSFLCTELKKLKLNESNRNNLYLIFFQYYCFIN